MTTLNDDATVAASPALAPRAGRTALVDARGCPVGTGSARAIEHAEKGLWRLLSYYGNALDDLDAAIAEDPTWALAHVMRANALLSMTEHGLGLLAADSLQRASELAAAGHANERERRHIAATRLCAAGQWQQACDTWERILLDHPQARDRRGHGHVVLAEGVGVDDAALHRVEHAVHHLWRGDDSPHRHEPARQRLGAADDVGLDIGPVLKGEPLARPAQAALHFVEDQQ